MKWADYCISKASYVNGAIDVVEIRPDLGESIGAARQTIRSELVGLYLVGNTFVTVDRDQWGLWHKVSDAHFFWNGSDYAISDSGTRFFGDSLGSIPLALPRRKVFVSYYHDDDQEYKDQFVRLAEDLIINKSVEKGDIEPDNSTEYIKHLIQRGFLSDASVIIVLLGSNTRGRKHVDWEISGGLDLKVGGNYAGLVGIALPTFPDYYSDFYYFANLPKRLAANARTKYSGIYKWTTDRTSIQYMVEEAFWGRSSRSGKRVNRAIPQMQRDTLGR